MSRERALTLARLAAEFRGGLRSPREVVEEALERIGRGDGELGAFRTVLAEEALTEAAVRSDELQRGEVRGPLHGIPVAVKELFDVAGAPVSYGSQLYADRVASTDAAAVARLRAAGAVVLGLTRSHEFGWGITTQHPQGEGTRNPWDLSRVPGGSSGGSAAAVSVGFAPLALGSDTGGSIRIPASFCGVVGLKPTYGSIPADGAVPLAFSLDHPGPIAACVADLRVAFEVLSGKELTEGRRPERLRIGLAKGLHWPDPSDDVARLFEESISALVRLGAELVELDLGSSGPIREAFTTIQMAEAFYTHNGLLGTFPGRANEYGADVRTRLEAARLVSLPDYLSARRAAMSIRQRFDEALRRVGALLTPVAAGGPSSVADPDTVDLRGERIAFRDLVMNFTTPQDLTGLPALSVPVGLDSDGLPVGVQFTAAAGCEAALLDLAAAFEREISFAEVPPPLHHVPRSSS